MLNIATMVKSKAMGVTHRIRGTTLRSNRASLNRRM
jgi:hypothetical protein